ncbi:MAG: hypothetical protein INQ03_05905 [Candidatus Heimdallarchaeota archaeon]|nr:hypothetical protein [Candidatus Heimdallarchaeota archaeon]
MPKEITKEEIPSIIPFTQSASVKRTGDKVKFKLRTKKTLYTIVASTDEADDVESVITSSGKSIDILELD